MNHKETIDIITDIETNIPVDKIEYMGIKIWPLIRLYILPQLTHDNTAIHGGQTDNPKRIWNYLLSAPSFLKRIINYFIYKVKYFSKFKKLDVVFLARTIDRREKIEGKLFNPFINSFEKILKNMKIKYRIFEYPLITKYKKPIYGHSIPIDKEIKFDELKTKIKKIFKKESEIQDENIILWDTLAKYIQVKYANLIKINKKNIISQTEKLLTYEKLFRKLLKKFQPKVCFLICYYDLLAMGCIRACRQLGIKSVDIQHGLQDKNHGMYSHWTRLPKNGYNIMPSHWWCWGEESTNRINNWSKKVYPMHHAVTGGNPWISWNINNTLDTDKNKLLLLEKIAPPNKINILVALQPIKQPITKILLESIKKSPNNLSWLIRLHPLMNKRKDEIFSELKKTGNKNIEIEYSSSISLFALLKKVDFLITFWSTIAYEALLFNVHPIIIHPNGLEAFSNYISKKLFSYTSSSKEIIDIINLGNNNYNYREEKTYIETNPEIIKKTLYNLVNL